MMPEVRLSQDSSANAPPPRSAASAETAATDADDAGADPGDCGSRGASSNRGSNVVVDPRRADSPVSSIGRQTVDTGILRSPPPPRVPVSSAKHEERVVLAGNRADLARASGASPVQRTVHRAAPTALPMEARSRDWEIAASPTPGAGRRYGGGRRGGGSHSGSQPRASAPSSRPRASAAIASQSAAGQDPRGASGAAASPAAVSTAGAYRHSHSTGPSSFSNTASLSASLPTSKTASRPSLLPPPPPQPPQMAGGGAGSGGGGGSNGSAAISAALRDLDGCLVRYTDDSAAEADIESMASVASVDSREDDLEAAASTDSEVASTASSTGGASSVCSGDSSRGRAANRDLSLSCSAWNDEGEEDVLLGLSLARARMTAGKSACSCVEDSCFCRFKNCASSQRSPAHVPSRVGPSRFPHATYELDSRDVALVDAINRMATGDRRRRDEEEGEEAEGARKAGASQGAGTPARRHAGAAAAGAGEGGEGAQGTVSPVAEMALDTMAEERREGVERAKLAVHPDCALEFAERFVRRDIALAGRVQAVRLLYGSVNAIYSVVVQCGGFRALYGWLGDVWERVRAHKLPRAGLPDWTGVGGRVYVEELLCVLARVPISVDMLRETEIARVAKKFRRLAERHGLESMTAASNRLRAHLHAVVSKGVQEGLFFRNRAVARSSGISADYHRNASSHQHAMSYPRRRQEPWNSRGALHWRSSESTTSSSYPSGYGGYGGTRGHASGGGSFSDTHFSGGRITEFEGESGHSRADGAATLSGEQRRGVGAVGTHHRSLSPSRGRSEHPAPVLRWGRSKGWRRRQDSGVIGVGIDGSGGRGDESTDAHDHRGGQETGGGRVHSGSSAGGSKSLSQEQAESQASLGGGNNSSYGWSLENTRGRLRGSGAYPRRVLKRRRISRVEPWILDLSGSTGGDGRRVHTAENCRRSSVAAGDGAFPGGDDGIWMNGSRATGSAGGGASGGGGTLMFRPVMRDDGGSHDRRMGLAFRPGFRPDGLENPSEDGSWEGSVDWWPRPTSPSPSGGGDSYYTGGDYASGGPLGPQGPNSLLPTVPTFEESGTRVSWADYRGHRLAEVHEIEPGYSREDFALPGRVGFIAETCRRDMSKKEEQLLSQEDHERLAAAALESDVLRARVYGGGTGGGGDSEGTISDSENSTAGDPDMEYRMRRDGDDAGDDNVEGDGALADGVAKPTASSNSSGGSQDGDDLSDRGGVINGDVSTSAGTVERDAVGSSSGLSEQVNEQAGRSPTRALSLRGGVSEGGGDAGDAGGSGSGSGSGPGVIQSRNGLEHSSENGGDTGSPRCGPSKREPGDERGSESGCSSLQSPQRSFSPADDDASPTASPPAISPRRFTSPTGQRSPPGSPTVSSPGSSRSGSVADGHSIFDGGSSDLREVVSCPTVAHGAWNQLQRGRPPSRDLPLPPLDAIRGRLTGRRMEGLAHHVVADVGIVGDRGLVQQSNGTHEARPPQSVRLDPPENDSVGGPGASGGGLDRPGSWEASTSNFAARETRWRAGPGAETGRHRRPVPYEAGRLKPLPLRGQHGEDEEDVNYEYSRRATAAILLGVKEAKAGRSSGGSGSGGGGGGGARGKAWSSPVREARRSEPAAKPAPRGPVKLDADDIGRRGSGASDTGDSGWGEGGGRGRKRSHRYRRFQGQIGRSPEKVEGGSVTGAAGRSDSCERETSGGREASCGENSEPKRTGAGNASEGARWAGRPRENLMADRDNSGGSSPDVSRRRASARRRVDNGGSSSTHVRSLTGRKAGALGERA